MTSAPRIRVRAGPSLSSLSPVHVNRSAVHISSPSSNFEGFVAVRLKGYRGPLGEEGGGQEEPNEGEELEEVGDSWSLAFQGVWKEEVKVEDIMFGNVWSKPIRDYLPYGTAAGLRVVKYVDPSLSCDLYADKPWALSPLFATLQRVSVTSPAPSPLPSSFTPKHGSFPEDVSALVSPPPATSAARRSFFTTSHTASLKDPSLSHTLTPSMLVRGDFSHGFIDFKTLSLALPGGLKFSLAKYWTGEPLVFECRRRQTESEVKEGKEPETYFVVSFELVGDDERAAAVKGEKVVEKKEEVEEVSDDVD